MAEHLIEFKLQQLERGQAVKTHLQSAYKNCIPVEVIVRHSGTSGAYSMNVHPDTSAEVLELFIGLVTENNIRLAEEIEILKMYK